MKIFKRVEYITLPSILLAIVLSGCSGDNNDNGNNSNNLIASGIVINPVSPTDGAINIATDTKLLAIFNQEMDAATVNGSSFTVVGENAAPMNGTVTFNDTTNSAIFTADSNFDADTEYQATITTNVKNVTGTKLETAFVWEFTTGTAADTTAPTVTATGPSNHSLDVLLNRNLSATFSEAIDPTTVTSNNFYLVKDSAPTTHISGVISYIGTTTVVFDPAVDLEASTNYTVTITRGITDLASTPNALVQDEVWRFTTGTAVAFGPAPVSLGTAGDYVVLAKSAISTTGTTALTGNLAVSPAAESFITGFALTRDSSNTFSTSALVTGQIFAANLTSPTPANLTTAVSNMETAYIDAAGRSNPDETELGAGNISGLTLEPGLYKWGTSLLMTSDVTLSGDATAVWILQIAQNLTVSNGVSVKLIGGALPENVFWQVAGQVTLGTTADFSGIILSKTQIVMQTGATLTGRALAQTAVTLDSNAVTEPAN